MIAVRLAVARPSVPAAVEYAVEAVADAVERRGDDVALVEGDEPADLVAGTVDDDRLVAVLGERLEVPDAAESFAIVRRDGTAYVVGRDAQGLMYGLLEVAERVEFQGADLATLPEQAAEPDTAFRGVYTFLHNEDCDAEWFHSEGHWQRYFDLLARSRYNAFNLVMGHQTNYLAPPFPWFVEVESRPDVTVPELSDEQRAANLAMLKYVTELAEQRGLDFVLGVWQVVAWLPGNGHAGHVQESLVDGLDWDNLRSYTHDALVTILEACPAIKGVQLRANSESGVPLDQQTEFWRETVFAALEAVDREVYLDLRGWGAHESTIETAREMNFSLRLSMKFWAEHLGGPYPAPAQQPAYSYADFLKYADADDVELAYQVWTLGSHRLFVWGDPEYARTFAGSLDLGDSVGFEICPPMAQKGYGNDPGAWRMLTPDYEHYDWEFERYWFFYRLFGRLTYDRETAADVWLGWLRARFGEDAERVLEGYRTASRVLSFVVRFNCSDPNMYVFPETDVGGVMDYYLDAPPTDPAVVNSFPEAAAEQASGEFTAKLDPGAASRFLRSLGERCRAYVDRLADAATEHDELRATLVDVEALGDLALYHAEKALAVEQLARFYETGDYAALDASVRQLERTTPHWDRLVEVTDGAYNDTLVTGPIDNLTWADKRPLVVEDITRAREQRELHRRYGGFAAAFDFGGEPELDVWGVYGYLNRSHTGDRPWLADFHVERGFTGVTADDAYDYTVDCGWDNTDGLTATAAPLVRLADKNLDTVRRTTDEPTGWEDLDPYGEQLFVDFVSGTGPARFTATVDPGRYEVVVIVGDRSPEPADHGPMTVTVEGAPVAEELTVPAGEVVDLAAEVELTRDQLRVGFDAVAGSDWVATGLVVRPVEPVLAHTPPQVLDPTAAPALTASVYRPDGVESVTAHVRPDDEEEVAVLPMETDGDERIYRAAVPPGLLKGTAAVEYWFEATNDTGRTRLPERDADEPTYEAALAKPGATISIDHEPVTAADAGQDVTISATIESDRPLRTARLHYRYANQYYDYTEVKFQRVGDTDRYEATIPGDEFTTRWDLMYYLEAVDDAGNGRFFPRSTPPDHAVRTVPYVVVTVDD